MIRRGSALLAAIIAVLGVGSCRDCNRAPWTPSLQPAFGARVSNGRLQIWTGSRCVGITRVDVFFDHDNLVLTSSTGRGVDVDHFVLDGPYPAGLVASQPLPAGFDWHAQNTMHVGPSGGSAHWGTTTDLAEIIKQSASHPDDTFFFQNVGWLNPSEVAAKDGKTFLDLCTPDPAKAKKN